MKQLVNFFRLLLTLILSLSACSQAHLISLAVPEPQHTPIHLPSGQYSLDKGHSSITLKVSHLGLSNYTMQFTSFDADLFFDASSPDRSTVTAIIYTGSIQTNYPYANEKDFDKELSTSSMWFNTSVFPTANFTSQSIKITGPNTGIIHGELTFLGITQPLSLDVKFNGGFAEKPFVGVPALGFSATTTLKRSEWKLDSYIPAIGDAVQIQIEAEFHKKPN